ncbi:hypothetical protein DFH09DRAFT_1107195 [Mycena vulgaris]|nr:hypothetical protein DFH09DRAFT_1109295 [Mycena vulgaris]KAJ6482401.1 hypothetical protein DFH09DRAFT_1107195 [Mycena vulgaris]
MIARRNHSWHGTNLKSNQNLQFTRSTETDGICLVQSVEDVLARQSELSLEYHQGPDGAGLQASSTEGNGVASKIRVVIPQSAMQEKVSGAATNRGDDMGNDDDEGESETEVSAKANLARDVGGKPSGPESGMCVRWRRDKQWNEPECKMLAEYNVNRKAAGRERQCHSRMRDGGKRDGRGLPVRVPYRLVAPIAGVEIGTESRDGLRLVLHLYGDLRWF